MSDDTTIPALMGGEAVRCIRALEDKVAWLNGFALALQQRVEELERDVLRLQRNLHA